jgi:3-isopropylmalate/(R)-2-methylmalate dehydratase small subunit
MKSFTKHSGLPVALLQPNIDTDQIVPKQFLKRVDRAGFGETLFYDWRFLPDGAADPNFVLNQPRYTRASILIAGANFGCGSSREHAPWALLDFGFRAIIAPSFADIFTGNCFKNGLLPVTLPEAAVNLLARRSADLKGHTVTVDLENRLVSDSAGFSAAFQIDDFHRECLLAGLDDIGLTLQHEDKIAEFEKNHHIV